MSNTTRITAAMIVLVVLFAVAIGLYFAGQWLISLFGELDRQVAIVTGIAVVTILFAVIILRGRSSSSESVSRVDSILSRKSEVYESLLRTVLKSTELCGGEPIIADDQTELKALRPQLMLFASSGVIRMYIEILNQSRPDNSEAIDETQLQKLIREMRKDLGQSSLWLQPEHLSIFLQQPSKSAGKT